VPVCPSVCHERFVGGPRKGRLIFCGVDASNSDHRQTRVTMSSHYARPYISLGSYRPCSLNVVSSVTTPHPYPHQASPLSLSRPTVAGPPPWPSRGPCAAIVLLSIAGPVHRATEKMRQPLGRLEMIALYNADVCRLLSAVTPRVASHKSLDVKRNIAFEVLTGH